MEIARTRKTRFRPFFLPPGQTRYLPEDYFQVAFSILQGARSISSAVRSLKLLDLPLTKNT
ncbi:MAG: hypothetical protein DSZ24_00410 [Thermodesulfatator sp.]|nr:MAG: hypothetical protein DSZ24_00410 [Thermodesulfatator sp.]